MNWLTTFFVSIVTAIGSLFGLHHAAVVNPVVPTPVATATPVAAPVATSTTTSTMTVSIMVPQNESGYLTAADAGQNPPATWPFVAESVVVPYSSDVIRASAEAAAEVIPAAGGPGKATVAYLTIENGTAYVLLNIDLDGWAGVSIAIARIHPLVEKTLLEFPQITKVVFGYAPGAGPGTTTVPPAPTPVVTSPITATQGFVITSITPASAYPGDTIRLHGNGIGTSANESISLSSVAPSGQETNVATIWQGQPTDDSDITFTLPQNTAAGNYDLYLAIPYHGSSNCSSCDLAQTESFAHILFTVL